MNLLKVDYSNQINNQRRLITYSYWISTLVDGASRIIIPLYLLELQITATNIGIAFFFYELSGLLTSVFSGFFINRFGYRSAFLLALFAHTVASLGYLFLAPESNLVLTLFLLNVLRAFRGVGKELLKTTSSAYFKRFRFDKKKGDRLQIQLLFGGKDGFKGLGILLGGVFLTVVGFNIAFLLFGLLTLACLIYSSRTLTDYKEHKQINYAGFFNVKRNLTSLAISRSLLYASRDLWLVIPAPLFLKSQGFSDLAVASALAIGLIVFGLAQPMTFGQMKSQWTIGDTTLKGKIRHRKLAVWAPVILCICTIGILLTSEWTLAIIIGILFYNLCAGMATVPHNHLHLKFARRSRTSLDIAFYKTIAHTGKLMAIPISGLIYSLYGIQGCLIASCFASLLSGYFAAMSKNTAKLAPELTQ